MFYGLKITIWVGIDFPCKCMNILDINIISRGGNYSKSINTSMRWIIYFALNKLIMCILAPPFDLFMESRVDFGRLMPKMDNSGLSAGRSASCCCCDSCGGCCCCGSCDDGRKNGWCSLCCCCVSLSFGNSSFGCSGFRFSGEELIRILIGDDLNCKI